MSASGHRGGRADGAVASPDAAFARAHFHLAQGEVDPFGGVRSVGWEHDLVVVAAGAPRERDRENGFYYHGARYYAPWRGRWISADPAGTADGLNLYAYVAGGPTAHTDPTGTQHQAAQDDAHPPPPPPSDPPTEPPGVPAPGASLTQSGGQPLVLAFPWSDDIQGALGVDTTGVASTLGVVSVRRLITQTADVGATVSGASGSSGAVNVGGTFHLGTPGRNAKEAWGEGDNTRGRGLYVAAGVTTGAGPAVATLPGLAPTSSSQVNPYASVLGAQSFKNVPFQLDINLALGYRRFASVAGAPFANVEHQLTATPGVNLSYAAGKTQFNLEATFNPSLGRAIAGGRAVVGTGWAAGAGVMFPPVHSGTGRGAVGVNLWITQDTGSTLGPVQPVAGLLVFTLAGAWR